MRTVPIELLRSLGLRLGRAGAFTVGCKVAVFDALRANAEEAVMEPSFEELAAEN